MGNQASTESDTNDADKNHPDNKQMEHEGWNSITEKKRGCTDFLFLVSFVRVFFLSCSYSFCLDHSYSYVGSNDDYRIHCLRCH